MRRLRKGEFRKHAVRIAPTSGLICKQVADDLVTCPQVPSSFARSPCGEIFGGGQPSFP